MSQARTDDNGYTHAKCVHCGKDFKFLSASPEYIEVIWFCSEKCRNLYFWFKGKSQFEELMETKKDV